MGMSVGGNSSGLTSDPNVVPMIDIMLVLLIVFMIMQPRVRKAIDLQLPDPNPQVMPANTKSDQIVMEVLPDARFRINKEDVTKERLAERLRQIYDPRPQKIIFIKGDTAVVYADVIFAMDIARGAGVKVIGVPPPDKAK
jgi:biopolymer transport protein TolR